MPKYTATVHATDVVTNYLRYVALEKTDPAVDFNVYIVWFCYILGGWKALVSTTLVDGRYYEVTHNGETDETYLDVYVKVFNTVVKP